MRFPEELENRPSVVIRTVFWVVAFVAVVVASAWLGYVRMSILLDWVMR